MTKYERDGMSAALAMHVIAARQANDYARMAALAGRKSWPHMLREAMGVAEVSFV